MSRFFTNYKKSPLKALFCLKSFCFLLLFSPQAFLNAQTIASIDNKKISLKEFQEFVDMQKFIANKEKLEDLLSQKQETRNSLLGEYIDHVLFLNNANELGYKTNSQEVIEEFERMSEKWVMSSYLGRVIDLEKIDVTEENLKKEYASLPANSTKKSFNELNQNELNQLRQIFVAKASQKEKDKLREKLMKQYKVKKNDVGKKIVFSVGKKDYSQEDFQNYFDEELKNVGASSALLKARDPKRYDELSALQLNEMILYELLKLELKRDKYMNKKEIKTFLRILKERLAIEMLKRTIAEEIAVSDKELNDTFSQLTKQNPTLEKMLPTEQERIVKNAVRQNKLPTALEAYLAELKESSVIKRFKDVLAKVD